MNYTITLMNENDDQVGLDALKRLILKPLLGHFTMTSNDSMSNAVDITVLDHDDKIIKGEVP
jgi:hypothetical protein